jgi:hypothetical protein
MMRMERSEAGIEYSPTPSGTPLHSLHTTHRIAIHTEALTVAIAMGISAEFHRSESTIQ